MSRSKKVILTSGKRKTSMARALIKPGRGRVRVNNVPLEILEPRTSRDKLMEPLLQAGEDTWKDLDIHIKVSGGGFMGQAEAARTAVARALLKWTKSARLRSTFSKYDRTMIASDPRRKESKKFGGPGARARDQKSYR
ncbi:MAG: 30S ribosomal protein S9 [Candidatus Bathyarchaeota archaeon]|nr:30S ribosomal protein S9 [Candidatus Bathyarchaeota archaeon]MDH5733313.1 30S ribosomal protein S9 [Candidatus Bathyarchaeota archaeon]